MTARAIRLLDGTEIPWQQFLTGGGRWLNAAQWHAKPFPDRRPRLPFRDFAHRRQLVVVGQCSCQRDGRLPQVRAGIGPRRPHLQVFSSVSVPRYEELIEFLAFLPTQNLPVGLEFPQLLGAVVRWVLDQPCQQRDVFPHRLQIHEFGAVGVDGRRFLVGDAHFALSAAAVHADMRQLASVLVRKVELRHPQQFVWETVNKRKPLLTNLES